MTEDNFNTMRKMLVVPFLLFALAATAGAQSGSPLLLNAAGATFPYPIYSKWFDVYHTAHPNVQINYQSIGSGGGIRQLLAGTVDFGASDGPMTDDQLAQSKVKILHFPTVLGADVPSYNISGVTGELNFTQKALAGIYLGTITKWNDPEIAKANPGVNLPGEDIVVVHRSDGSGTTYIWTDFLSKASDDWKNKVGKGTSVNWPVGLGGKGNEGVSGLVKQTPNSIGYIELIYAVQNNIPYGKVQNAAGKFVKADLAGVTRGGRFAEGYAGRFPRLHHQRSGSDVLPDLELYVAADPCADFGCREARRDQGLPEVDAGGRAEVQRRAVLRAAPQNQLLAKSQRPFR